MENTRLRAARKKSGKTQAQVAKEAGISEAMYQRYEYGWSIPSVLIAFRIADVLGVNDLRELFAAAPTEHDNTSKHQKQENGTNSCK